MRVDVRSAAVPVKPDARSTNPPAMSYVLEHAVPSTIGAAAPPAAVSASVDRLHRPSVIGRVLTPVVMTVCEPRGNCSERPVGRMSGVGRTLTVGMLEASWSPSDRAR